MALRKAQVGPALHMIHMIICIVSMGWIFPHALIENEELVVHEDMSKTRVR